MKRKLKALARPLLFVLCLALLVWMVIKAGPGQLWHTLCAMPGTICCCVLIWGVGYLFNAASFREVLHAIHPQLRGQMGYRQILRLTITGYALNYVTPFGLLGGEPYRIMELKPLIGQHKAMNGVLVYASMHVVSHFIQWALSALVAWFVLDGLSDPTEGAPTALVGLTLAGFFRLFKWSELSVSTRFKALGLEFASRMVNVLEYQLIMQTMGFEGFGYVEALLCVAFSSFFANVLFFSPMQMGTREGGIFLALQQLMPDLPAQELLAVSLSLSFATRIREFMWIFIGLLGVDFAGFNKTKTE